MDLTRPERRIILFILLLCLVIGAAAVISSGLLQPPPIRVGFSAQLTGSGAELGVQERNGVDLAVKDINAAGGISGRPVELIVRDDLGTPEGARAADRELISRNIVAIIGHATSGQTVAGLEVTEPAGIVMISPTTSTAALTGKDDHFFRVLQTLEDRARGLALHIYQNRNLTRLAILYDTDNAAYVESYRSIFGNEYRKQGGLIVAQADFSSKTRPDFAPLLAGLQSEKPDALLIIAMDSDTAMIAQRTRIMGWQVPLFTSAWAQTATLISNGGHAVEGIELEQALPMNSHAPAYLDFKKRFIAAYGTDPAFGAVFGYETVHVLGAALKTTGGSPAGLPDAILSLKNIPGLTGNISFDPYGDVQRPYFLGTVRNGTFVDLAAERPGES